ncbi:hypothetical protein ElyMa_000596900 [Elysia marginata]|uniref:Uncharacterized protein n=1 Tax=Elysia marginata TaxID=1093978 RepID=A0AAV4G6N2_9GAST|nr:hypothetical protein ElyMa_000596900 [Elysia marginata]
MLIVENKLYMGEYKRKKTYRNKNDDDGDDDDNHNDDDGDEDKDDEDGDDDDKDDDNREGNKKHLYSAFPRQAHDLIRADQHHCALH